MSVVQTVFVTFSAGNTPKCPHSRWGFWSLCLKCNVPFQNNCVVCWGHPGSTWWPPTTSLRQFKNPRFTVPDSVEAALIGVGDTVHCGVAESEGKHAAMKWLLGQGKVGGVVCPRHDVHIHRTLQQKKYTVPQCIGDCHFLLWLCNDMKGYSIESSLTECLCTYRYTTTASVIQLPWVQMWKKYLTFTHTPDLCLIIGIFFYSWTMIKAMIVKPFDRSTVTVS